MSEVHASLVDIAHKRLDRADSLLALYGATELVLEAYRATVRAFCYAQVPWWAQVAAQRAQRTLELL